MMYFKSHALRNWSLSLWIGQKGKHLNLSLVDVNVEDDEDDDDDVDDDDVDDDDDDDNDDIVVVIMASLDHNEWKINLTCLSG